MVESVVVDRAAGELEITFGVAGICARSNQEGAENGSQDDTKAPVGPSVISVSPGFPRGVNEAGSIEAYGEGDGARTRNHQIDNLVL